MIIKNALSVLALAGLVALPLGASAQNGPGYGSQDEVVRGTVASLDGKYTLYLHDARGYVDTVRLHDGTIINPTGLELQPGQSIVIHGRTDGHVFDANEIDTPDYNPQAGPVEGPPPPADDYGYDDAPAPSAVYVAPYPYYAYYPAYALSYPAFVSLGFGFGCCFGGYYGHGWYGYGGYHGYYGYNGYGHPYGGYYGPGYGYRGYTASGTYGGYARSYGTTPYGYRAPTGGYRGTTGGYRGTTSSAVRSSGGGASFHGGGGSSHH